MFLDFLGSIFFKELENLPQTHKSGSKKLASFSHSTQTKNKLSNKLNEKCTLSQKLFTLENWAV